MVKTKIKNLVISLLFFISMIIIINFLLYIVIPKGESLMYGEVSKSKMEDGTLDIVSIGDSLTEGIGDDVKLGGYVPVLKQDLSLKYPSINVNIENFGKSGSRTPQLIEKIRTDEELISHIKNADIILITIGANDLTKILKDNILNNITKETFVKKYEEYSSIIKELYDEIRQINSDCMIYHLGIYNPFYLAFPQISELQEVVDEWNQITKNIVESYENSEFIPINDLIYKGNGYNQEDKNNLISEDDSFHPNNIGYQIIAHEFRDYIVLDEEIWLK